MKTFESERSLISKIFFNYIFCNPINRRLMLPVLTTTVISKYLEVLSAKKTGEITGMIKSGTSNFNTIFAYSIVLIVGILLVEAQSFLLCKTGQIGSRIANRDAFSYFLNLSPEKFSTTGKGEIQNSISRKSQAVQDMIDVITLNFLPTFLTIIFVSYEVFVSFGLKTVVVVNLFTFIYCFFTIKITQKRSVIRKKLNKAQNDTSDLLVDSLYNYETVFSYKSEDVEVAKYDCSLKSVEKLSTDMARSMYVLNLFQRGTWCVMSIFIVFSTCYFSSNMIDVEQFAIILSITALVSRSMDNMGYLYGKFKFALTNARISLNNDDFEKQEGFRSAFRLNHSLSAHGLSIRRGNKMIIDSANFEVKKGEKVVIVGKNGTGKSTLLKSLVNLNNFEGSIYVDEIDTKDLTSNSLKNIITYIPQNAVLFNSTIMENIKYANTKIFDEEVIKTAKLLGVHESINKLENKYNAKVGEQGKLLSGGERQKVLILRSLLRNTSMLLMDEATASLDKQAELKIFKHILSIEDLTVIAIVHNLELIELFDKALVVKDGGITTVDLKTTPITSLEE